MRNTRAHSGPTRDGQPVGAVELAARIVDVDPRGWTCKVRTEILEKTPQNVQVGGAYLDTSSGAGIYAMPDVGDLVYVTKSSEGDAPWHISGYRAYPSKTASTSGDGTRPSAAGNRPRLAPGDMAVVGRDKNGLFVRRGQFTEILGGPLARTSYIGRSGEIRSLAKTTRLDVFGGSAHWLVDREEADPDGHKRTRLDLKLKEFADDRSHVARLEFGGGVGSTIAGEPDGVAGVHGGAPASAEVVHAPVARLRVFADGDVEEGALDTVFSLSADKAGQVELSSKATVVLSVRGAKNATVTIRPDGRVSVESDADVEVTSATAVRHIVGALTTTHTAVDVSVGAAAVPVLVDRGRSTAEVAAWIEVAALYLSQTGVPAPGIVALIALLSGGTFTATKLRSE